MRTFLVMAALAAALAAGLAVGAPAWGQQSACSARAIGAWRPAASAPLRVEAYAEGPNCTQAVATLVVRDATGGILWADAFAAARVMSLADARDALAMRAALARWIDPAATRLARASDLPPWPANAEYPASGEFPFYPESWLDRASYEALRARGDPIFCYVQGMESIACLALSGGQLSKVGVQTFPG
ncbi:MAG: hypothetical protein JNJ73_03935 [Hyphomonadaceae bacterium]|nr:hypothetical protein [Hyphomonadaceae bacterium]